MERTLAEPLVLDFKAGISPDRAERVIKALGEEETPNCRVTLRFEGYPYVNTGVGWRIGNSLRRYSGDLLRAEMPPFLEGRGDWYRSFTQSGLGDAIAAHAGRIFCDGEDVTGRVKSYYAEKAVRQSQNGVVWGDLDQGLSINPEREDLFRAKFVGSLKYVNVRPGQFDQERLADVVKLTFEAIQNVYDHASRRPLLDGTKILSYASLRYFRTIEANHPDPEGRLRDYLSRLQSETPRARKDFIEVCVTDDGVGIAARQSQNSSIYWGDKVFEENAVRDALTSRSSVKLRARDCRVRGTPGQGFTYIDSCLRAIRAFAILRTGRLLAVLDGTEGAESGFELVGGDLGYMPGTTLDVLIPILNEGHDQLPLFPDE